MTTFGLIDYGMGNLLSVRNALEAVGARVRVVSIGSELDEVGPLVLPGVGAFGAGMAGLKARGFLEPLQRVVRQQGRPILGICLGMQLFGTRGLELGDHHGLGWLGGDVVKLDSSNGQRVPHVGWNDVDGAGKLFKNIPKTSFYFVHSYHLAVSDPSVVSGRTDYGGPFVSAVEATHIFGVQFHPEKSHRYGLALLKNYVDLASV